MDQRWNEWNGSWEHYCASDSEWCRTELPWCHQSCSGKGMVFVSDFLVTLVSPGFFHQLVFVGNKCEIWLQVLSFFSQILILEKRILVYSITKMNTTVLCVGCSPKHLAFISTFCNSHYFFSQHQWVPSFWTCWGKNSDFTIQTRPHPFQVIGMTLFSLLFLHRKNPQVQPDGP